MDLSIGRKNQYLTENSMVGTHVRTNQQPSKDMKYQRLIWLDIAKEIGILAVICGHNMPDYILNVQANRYWYDFIYWWHMPLFFLIGGFFLKPINLLEFKNVTTFLKKRVRPLLSSYFLAGLLLIIAYMLIHKTSVTYGLTYLLKLLYGGKTLSDYTTVFWYPETYLLGVMGTTLIISTIRLKPIQLLIACSFVYWSTSYKQLTNFKAFDVVTAPWDMDVAVLVIAYMLIGYNLFYFGKHYLTKWYVFLPALLTVSWLFLQLKNQELSFSLFMRSHQFSGAYQHLSVGHNELALMVGIIPVLCCLVIFGMSQIVAYPLKVTHSVVKIGLFPVRLVARTLLIAGNHTLIIMYMHKMILDILDINHVTNSFWLQVFIAALVPLIIGVFFKQYRLFKLGHLSNIFVKQPV